MVTLVVDKLKSVVMSCTFCWSSKKTGEEASQTILHQNVVEEASQTILQQYLIEEASEYCILHQDVVEEASLYTKIL